MFLWAQLAEIRPCRALKVSLRILTQEEGKQGSAVKTLAVLKAPHCPWRALQTEETLRDCSEAEAIGVVQVKEDGGSKWRGIDEFERYLGGQNIQQLVSDWTWGEGAGGIKNN